MNLLDEVSRHRKNIKYEMVTLTLSELVRMYESVPNEVSIRPDFQRLFRWDREQQSLFIESLILEIPVPPLFCYEDEDGIWELLDGLQRYSTILRFLGENNEIPDEMKGLDSNNDNWHYEKANDLNTKLQLVKGDYLDKMEGMTFDRLPVQLQRNLKRARIQIYVLKRETHKMYKYEVFKRLNRGGSTLEDQEVRNCSARLLGHKFADFLREVANKSEFIELLGVSDTKVQQAFSEEMLLRYLAIKNNRNAFVHDVSPFLDSYMAKVSSEQIPFDFETEKDLFNKIINILSEIEDRERVFRSRKSDDRKAHGPFSSTIFEAVMFGIAKNIDNLTSLKGDEIESKIIDFIIEAKKNSYIGAGANTIKKFNGRLELAEEKIK